MYGLTYNSMNWSNLCICYTFEEWNFVYCTVFSRISWKCCNFCDLRAYFTKWEISCNIVWLSYQNPKYRVISCVSKKSISLRGGGNIMDQCHSKKFLRVMKRTCLLDLVKRLWRDWQKGNKSQQPQRPFSAKQSAKE